MAEINKLEWSTFETKRKGFEQVYEGERERLKQASRLDKRTQMGAYYEVIGTALKTLIW